MQCVAGFMTNPVVGNIFDCDHSTEIMYSDVFEKNATVVFRPVENFYSLLVFFFMSYFRIRNVALNEYVTVNVGYRFLMLCCKHGVIFH